MFEHRNVRHKLYIKRSSVFCQLVSLRIRILEILFWCHRGRLDAVAGRAKRRRWTSYPLSFFFHTFSLQVSAMLVDVKVLRFEPRNLGLWPDDSHLWRQTCSTDSISDACQMLSQKSDQLHQLWNCTSSKCLKFTTSQGPSEHVWWAWSWDEMLKTLSHQIQRDWLEWSKWSAWGACKTWSLWSSCLLAFPMTRIPSLQNYSAVQSKRFNHGRQTDPYLFCRRLHTDR